MRMNHASGEHQATDTAEKHLASLPSQGNVKLRFAIKEHLRQVFASPLHRASGKSAQCAPSAPPALPRTRGGVGRGTPDRPTGHQDASPRRGRSWQQRRKRATAAHAAAPLIPGRHAACFPCGLGLASRSAGPRRRARTGVEGVSDAISGRPRAKQTDRCKHIPRGPVRGHEAILLERAWEDRLACKLRRLGARCALLRRSAAGCRAGAMPAPGVSATDEPRRPTPQFPTHPAAGRRGLRRPSPRRAAPVPSPLRARRGGRRDGRRRELRQARGPSAQAAPRHGASGRLWQRGARARAPRPKNNRRCPVHGRGLSRCQPPAARWRGGGDGGGSRARGTRAPWKADHRTWAMSCAGGRAVRTQLELVQGAEEEQKHDEACHRSSPVQNIFAHVRALCHAPRKLGLEIIPLTEKDDG